MRIWYATTFHISKMPLNTDTATGKDVSRVGFMALNVANRSDDYIYLHAVIHNFYDTRTMTHHDIATIATERRQGSGRHGQQLSLQLL